MTKPKLILVGGFLGAGKTTLLSVTAKLLKAQNRRVGLITNDQAAGLVDTHILEHSGLDVREVSGSCFCCDFNGLVEAIDYLIGSSKCDILLAEPVGSCTDLSATLIQPLRSLYGNTIGFAPLSVLVDPWKLQTIFEDDNFSKDGPGYIYLKQLEEADYIVVNKLDLLDDKDKAKIDRLLSAKFPNFLVDWISAQEELGIPDWLDKILSGVSSGQRIAKVDYDVYAEGEALMGWYNASFIVRHIEDKTIDWAAFNKTFLILFQKVFNHEKIILTHLKSFLKSGTSHSIGNILAKNDVSLRGEVFYSKSTRMTLNIRAEVSHVIIDGIVKDIVDIHEDNGFRFGFIEVKHFNPARPNPSYRYDKVLL